MCSTNENNKDLSKNQKDKIINDNSSSLPNAITFLTLFEKPYKITNTIIILI